MLQDLTAKELKTIRVIQNTELIGNDRRDMVLAKGLAAICVTFGSKATYQELIREFFPLEVPEREQSADDMFAALDSLAVKHGPKHSNTGGEVHGGHVGT